MAVLLLRFCAGLSLAVRDGFCLGTMSRLLIMVASLGVWASAVAGPWPGSCDSWGLGHRLNSCGAWTELLPSTWDSTGSEINLWPLCCQAGSSSLSHQRRLVSLSWQILALLFANCTLSLDDL